MNRTFLTAIVMVAVLSPAIQPAADVREETHCVVDVIGERADGELIVSEPRCYGTFAGAMADASDGTLMLPASTRGAVMFADIDVAEAASSFTLGIHFDYFDGGGSSISISGTSCSGGWWNTGTAWHDRISSTYNGCARLRHYTNANMGGSFEDTKGVGTRDNLTSYLNNKADSVSYN
jgi:hypothetical protein